MEAHFCQSGKHHKDGHRQVDADPAPVPGRQMDAIVAVVAFSGAIATSWRQGHHGRKKEKNNDSTTPPPTKKRHGSSTFLGHILSQSSTRPNWK